MGETCEIRHSSLFMEAFYEYFRALPEKKNKKSILSHIDINNPPTPEDIQESVRHLEIKHGQKTSVKILRRVFGPVVSVLKDYYGVLDSLTQADPTPSCVIWGTLKIVIDGLGRFIDLFEKIQTELLSLNIQLRRLTLYEFLYGHSSDMQGHLFRSYRNVFRFWCRVEKECNRNSFNALLRASASFSTKKLQSIVEDLKENANDIEKLAPIIEAQFAGAERAEAAHERYANKKERDEGSAWRGQMQSDRIRAWLGSQALTEANISRHRNNLDMGSMRRTCYWLSNEPKFRAWKDGTLERPIMWFYAGPGSGKSTLCSYAVESIRDLEPKSAFALHFYEFDDPQRTALTTAKTLASQLFDHYWLLTRNVAEDILAASQSSAADVANIFEFIRLVVTKLRTVYIFIDGLDEECNQARWKEAIQILDFLNTIATDSPTIVRLWYSSQDAYAIRTKMENFLTMHIQEQIKVSVDEYISTMVPGINNTEVDQDTRAWILTELRSRAKGNFLWASLMVKTIEAEVSSFDEMERFIKQGLPKDLNSYYGRIFARYEPRERDLACKIFGLVTFARRRLRLSEIREAIGITSCDEPGVLKSRNIPWRHAVEKLFAPLIETQQDPDTPLDCFCYLFHSTVKHFLEENSNILQQALPSTPPLLIDEFIIANACLLYLSQDKYEELLVKDADHWMTSSKESVTGTSLMTYSAKYWDKHLDAVKESPELRRRVEIFLTSRNFQTTLQVQSLFVEGHFGIYTMDGKSDELKYTKRVFPHWFASHSSKGCADMARNYRSFTSEWCSFLCGEIFEGQYSGELDRCLWGSLGPQSFLSHNRERYFSFMLVGKEGLRAGDRIPYHAGISAEGNEVIVLREQDTGFSSTGGTHPVHRHMRWNLKHRNGPQLLSESTITWDHDVNKDGTLGEPAKDIPHFERTRPISFSPDLSCLRIGSQILFKDKAGNYSEIGGFDLTTEHPLTCFEDVLLHNSVLVLASRQKYDIKATTNGRQKQKKRGTNEGNNYTQSGKSLSLEASNDANRSQNQSDEGPVSSITLPTQDENVKPAQENASDSESMPSSSEAESSAWNSAEESWSDGSTGKEDDCMQFKVLGSSDEESSETSDMESESDDHGETSAKDDASDAPIASYGQLLEDSDDSANVQFEWDSDGSSYEADSDGSAYDASDQPGDDFFCSSDDEYPSFMAYARSRREHKTKVEQGSLVVYDITNANPVQLFKFVHSLPLMLYGSPPVIHPTKSLVVWPLCGGDVLFADYDHKSYFIRKQKPSGRQTRHVFMKFHFSGCGQYLHIASLEAQQKSLSKQERKRGTQSALLLSAFVSTHRLSSRKTTRSPPTLIHRVKAFLGKHTALSPTRTPFEVTWGPRHAYFSSSSHTNRLVLFRFDLFAPYGGQDDDAVCVPKETILLPESARVREVYYFPPREEGDRALVLIGSLNNIKNGKNGKSVTRHGPSNLDSLNGLPERTSPPIGFYLRENEDLGGWGPSNAIEHINPNTAKGSLQQKMEKFSAEDDCDIEMYFIA